MNTKQQSFIKLFESLWDSVLEIPVPAPDVLKMTEVEIDEAFEFYKCKIYK